MWAFIWAYAFLAVVGVVTLLFAVPTLLIQQWWSDREEPLPDIEELSV